MRKKLPVLLYRYGITVPVIGVAVLLTGLLPPLEPTPSMLFFGAVAMSAWYGGLGPGLVATGLSVLALDYYFVDPVYALGVGAADAVRLALFCLVSILISWLDAARKRVEEALREQNRHKEEFLAMLAHELRTPLSTSFYALEALRHRGGDPAIVEETCQLLDRQLRKMTRLIKDQLDEAGLRLGKLRLSRESVDVAHLVDHAVETVRPLIATQGHQLEVCVPAEPLQLDADPTRLEQIVVNLLENAAKYTPPRGHIWLRVERSTSGLRLRVKDTGVGLAPEALPRIFDRFAQVENGSRGGLGIGLSLVRDLVALHGGTVMASSEGLGRGSEFTVCLPWSANSSQTEAKVVGLAD
jgi:signal transduction histidine kinase